MQYCFLASVYKNSKIEEVKLCVNDMLSQTLPPSQIVIVADGAVEKALAKYLHLLEENPVFSVVYLPKNVGLGNALRAGMERCRYEMIARMDTDDRMEKRRIEKQLAIFKKDETLSLVGSNIDEFIDSVENVQSVRSVPKTHKEICAYLKKRCPFNHMTVVFKKSEVEKAGGYLAWHFDEDYYLWVRMYLAGCKFYNVQENLVHARIDENTFLRRGGWEYYKSERDLFKFMYKRKLIGYFAYQKAKMLRFILQVLLPNKARAWVFKKFARTKS